MTDRSSSVIEAVPAMDSRKTYTLDDLVDYAVGRLAKYFKNKEDVLSLFDGAYFEERKICVNENTRDTIQGQVLRVGDWGLFSEEELWAGRINGHIVYCRGKSNETVSILPGASSNPFLIEHHQLYFKNDLEPFSFLDPETESTKNSEAECLAKYLDHLVDIIFLCHQLIKELPENKWGLLKSQFKNLCMMLYNGNKHTSTTGRDDTPAAGSASSSTPRPLKRPRLAESRVSSRRASTPIDPSAYKASKKTFDLVFERNEALEEENVSLKDQLHQSHLQKGEMTVEIGDLKRRIEELSAEKSKAVEDAKSRHLANVMEVAQLQRRMEDLTEEKTKAVADAQSQNESMVTEIQQLKRRIEELSEEKAKADERAKKLVQMYKNGAKDAEEYEESNK